MTSQRSIIFRASHLAGVALVLLASLQGSAADWTIQRMGHLPLDTTLAAAPEMSGLSYVGPAAGNGIHQFVVATETSGSVTLIDLGFDSTGVITSANSVAQAAIAANHDFEGAAFTNPLRNSVWLSEETGPGLQEYDLGSGSLLQAVSLPTVFNQAAVNRGLESLTIHPNRSTLWTANEEALIADGEKATTSHGTTVRLLQLPLAADTAAPAAQYAYEVEPIHTTALASTPQSGLVDLVALPDGTLLALERSFSFTLGTTYLNRIFAIDLTAATDISGPAFATGLRGQSYVPVAKELLWSGTADGETLGQNLEGLALGPRLDDGSWMLVGVVDDGGAADPISEGIVVSWRLTAIESADFDHDGSIAGEDLLAWQRGAGRLDGALFSSGDANRDGAVDEADLLVWESNFGAAGSAARAVPEPATLCLTLLTMSCLATRRRTM